MRLRLISALIVIIPLLAACKKQEAQTEAAPPAQTAQPAAAPQPSGINVAALGAFQPLPEWKAPEGTPQEMAQIDLGRKLYYDTRLSKNQDISCNSCHLLEKYGVDNQPVSFGHRKQKGSRNSPTVYNAANHIAQFWDGRAKDLVEQAKGPILNPVEMAMSGEVDVLAVLRSIPEYVEEFKKAFPGEAEPVTYNNVAQAIAAFEKPLTTPSRWDAFLRGNHGALTDAEKAGFDKFVETGCTACHFGQNVGGAMFQKLGLVKPWPDQLDAGKFEVTKNEADRMMFKVPSLRNIEKTAPYFHNGTVKTLEDAVAFMAEHQLGKTLSKDDAASIITWLRTLTGDLPKEYIKKPDLPASTDKTPRPNPD